jgi:aspartate oxidase
MKSLHFIFENGVHVANQLAKNAERACFLHARKTGKNWKNLAAVAYANTTDKEVEVARQSSIEKNHELRNKNPC